jgi:hypothetical protein
MRNTLSTFSRGDFTIAHSEVLTLYQILNSHWMEVSEVHTKLGEAFGFVCWMWIFHRARNDLPVVLGWRHPWEHAEDPWADNVPKEDDIEGIVEMRADWEKFNIRASNPEEDDVSLLCSFLLFFRQTFQTHIL